MPDGIGHPPSPPAPLPEGWRADLVGALARRQESNGARVNEEDRFMEGDPHIVTSYGLLALAAARPKA